MPVVEVPLAHRVILLKIITQVESGKGSPDWGFPHRKRSRTYPTQFHSAPLPTAAGCCTWLPYLWKSGCYQFADKAGSRKLPGNGVKNTLLIKHISGFGGKDTQRIGYCTFVLSGNGALAPGYLETITPMHQCTTFTTLRYLSLYTILSPLERPRPAGEAGTHPPARQGPVQSSSRLARVANCSVPKR